MTRPKRFRPTPRATGSDQLARYIDDRHRGDRQAAANALRFGLDAALIADGAFGDERAFLRAARAELGDLAPLDNIRNRLAELEGREQ